MGQYGYSLGKSVHKLLINNDSASGYEPGGRTFESFRARHMIRGFQQFAGSLVFHFPKGFPKKIGYILRKMTVYQFHLVLSVRLVFRKYTFLPDSDL